MSALGAERANGLTVEQEEAVRRREGDLFLDAGAGSGKTTVLVERFARAVVEDGVEPTAILTITFTDKAAAEMRERIRGRLRELDAIEAARATENAFISTIHGFCARVLRAHALSAGIDPTFRVLDELESGQLAEAAFEAALIDAVENLPGALTLTAGYGRWDLRGAVTAAYHELRSRGETEPRLPPIPAALELDPLRAELQTAANELAIELREVPEPSSRVLEALDRLASVDAVVDPEDPWPGELGRLRLPGGNGAALSTEACAAYTQALEALRAAAAHRWAERAYPLFDRLLRDFSARYRGLKRERGGLDFEDLELLCRDLLRERAELRERFRDRYARVMVDELQDTNAVQLELIDMVSAGNLFTVGDAQQAIYGFRHADVELFAQRGSAMAERDERLTLATNFRSRPEILAVINRVFEGELGASFRPLIAGRRVAGADAALVELLVIDQEAEWAADGLASPWRLAEARALACRVAELLADGVPAADVVVLTRATSDLRAYERALEEQGVPTYLIGGRGYWSHPQVVDLVSYLRVLANPRDEEALYTVLASPLVGVSTDGLVMLAAAGRESGRDPWWVLRDPEQRLDALAPADRERTLTFGRWAGEERAAAARLGVEALVDRLLERTGYDLYVLALPGGQRRLANVRKLMRLGRQHLIAHGPGLRSFLDLVALRTSSWLTDPDASEAPVESEGLDAVRLMTIHRAKGLEFPVVCIADLGRGPRWGGDVIRVGRDGRLGIRLARPGSGRREPALAYDELGDEARDRAAREERRLFYVAVTRARERLILSGAAKVDAWGASNGGAPMSWLGPGLVSDISAGEGVSEGVRFRVVRPEIEDEAGEARAWQPQGGAVVPSAAALAPLPPVVLPPTDAVSSLSYTSLAAYERCGYRFYVERVLGIPATDVRGREVRGSDAVLDAAERGTLVHALLERLDFRRPVLPGEEAIRAAAPREPSASEVEDIRRLLERFAGSEIRQRLGRSMRVRREQRFAFVQDALLITGMFDAIAVEPGHRTLIVDYKTDRIGEVRPEDVVAEAYGTQQLIYALAALRAGAEAVEVVHLFLEAAEAPVSVSFTGSEVPGLEAELSRRTMDLRAGVFSVTDTPQRGTCHGCPAEGGLCSWPLEMTRREAPDRLF
ncbi:MAG TPA: UvrD-helicase domain-containing protein [Solirubrobacteraceae bacterium]|nr:UvrD-helicase domain-containing protein [Solirubrobacteraceae bacterium]